MRNVTRIVTTSLLVTVAGLAATLPTARPSQAVIEQIYSLPFEGQYTISCAFGCYSGHQGTDYQLGDAGAGGHPVLAAKGGTTWLYQQIPAGAGYYIVTDHGNGQRTRYLHLSSRVTTDGQIVARGQTIGFEGMSGDDDNHLHFEARHDGTPGQNCCSGTAVNPYGASTYMWKTNPPSMGREMDWSGDGYADVLARNSSGELCLFPGNGNSGWITYPGGACLDGTRIGTGWDIFDWLIRPGDWSGDGCHDILARKPNGQLYLYTGDCAMGFIGSGALIGSGWGASNYNWLWGPGDYSGDGFSDVLARKPSGDVCLFRGNGNGGFLSNPDAPCDSGKHIGWGAGSYSGLVAPSDFGGGVTGACADTIGDTSSGSLRIRYGGCNETWGSEATIGSGWQDYEVMLGPGDFSGDRCLDILARKYTGSPDFYLFRGNCVGGFLSGAVSLGSGWWGFDKLF